MGPAPRTKSPYPPQFFYTPRKPRGEAFLHREGLFVGRMYCPNVTTSTPASLPSLSAFTTCGLVSPRPNMSEVFVIKLGERFRVPQHPDARSQFARRSLTVCSSGTVSTLCAKTSRPDAATSLTSSASP